MTAFHEAQRNEEPAEFRDHMDNVLAESDDDEIDDGLLFFYGGVLLLIVHAKHIRAELLNSNTPPAAKTYLLCSPLGL